MPPAKNSKNTQTWKNSKNKKQQQYELIPFRYFVAKGCLSLAFFSVDKLTWPVCIIAVVWIGVYWPVEALANDKTEVIVDILADVAINDWVYWLVIAVLGSGNGVQFAAKRYRDKRNNNLEKEVKRVLNPHMDDS